MKKERGGINIKSLFVSILTMCGLVVALTLNQSGREKNIGAVEIIQPVRPATAAPDIQPERKAPVRPAPAVVRGTDAEKSVQRLKDYMKDTEGKSAFLKEKVRLLDDLLNSKGKEISRLNTDNAILKENLNKAVEQQNKLKADFQAAAESMNAQLSQKDADISRLNTAKAGLENQLSELNNKFSALSTDYTGLRGKTIVMEQEGVNLNARLAQLKDDLDKQKAANESLQKNISELTAGIAAKENQRQEISGKLEQLTAAKNSIEAELAQLKITNANNENNIKQLNNRINELSASYEEAKRSLFQMTGLLSTKEQEMTARQNEISALKESLVKSDGGKSMLLASLDEKEKTVRELNLALANMETRVAALQKDLTAERQRQAAADKQLADAASLNNNLKRKLKNIYIELELIRAEKTGSR